MYPERKNSSNKLNFMQKLVIYYIPFQVFFDLMRVFYSGGGGQSLLAQLRGLLMFTFFILLVPKASRKVKANRSIFIFILYISFLFLFASNLSYSLNVSVKIFMTLLAFVVSFRFINDRNSFLNLIDALKISYFIIFINLSITNLFNLGGGLYTSEVDFQTGGLVDNWNVITYLLLLAPLYFIYEKRKFRLWIFSFFYITLLVILIISFKRIAIAGYLFGTGIFALLYGKFVRFIKNSIIVLLVLLSLFPFYDDIVFSQYRAREDRFQQGALEEESRYGETIAVWEEIFSFRNPAKSLFGLEAFNSVGQYAGGSFGRRQTHVDYNLILISNGLVGLFLYLLIFYNIFRTRKKLKIYYKNNEFKVVNAVFYSVFFTSLFTSLGGQMYGITFRSIIFLYLGGMLRFLINYSNNKENESSENSNRL